VKVEEVEKLMNEGWEPIMTLPDGRVVIKPWLESLDMKG